MSKLKVGDTVICGIPALSIDGHSLVRGKRYTIKEIVYCRCDILYDVGFPLMDRGSRCGDCGTNVSGNTWLLRASRFTKDFQPAKNIPVEKFN